MNIRPRPSTFLYALCPVLFAAASSTSPAADPAGKAAATQPARAAEFIVGVGTHFGGHRFTPPTLEMLRQCGVRSVRDEIGWIGVERKKGTLAVPAGGQRYFDHTQQAGLDPLLILDYGNPFYDRNDKPISAEAVAGFVRYAEFMVRHFKGKLHLYEFWNEWDIAIGGTTAGTADTYVALLKKVYPAVKKIDPKITLIAGAVTPRAIFNGWLERMLKLGALDFCDAVSVHTYNYGHRDAKGSPEQWLALMRRTQALLRKYSGGKAVPVYVTEHGWPTQIDRRGRSPAVAAAYLARLYLLARTLPWLKGVWWYDFQDDGWKHEYNEHNFGIVRPDLTPKPAWYALRDVAEIATRAEFRGRVETKDPDVWVLAFRRPNARDVWAIWSAHAAADWQVVLQAPAGKREPVTVRQVGRAGFRRSWGDCAWYERGGRFQADQIRLTVRGVPWLIEGTLDGVKVVGVTRREFPESKRPRPAK